MSARSFGRGARTALGARVLLAVLLVVGIAVLVIDLADAWYVRVDLSASGRNTLDPEVADLVEELPEPVTVDVFFQPMLPPYQAVSHEAQQRMLELLLVARNARRDVLEVRTYDPDDPGPFRARQAELGVEGLNLVVVSRGRRQTALELFGEIAAVDWGNPTPRGLQYLAQLGIAGAVRREAWDPRAFAPPRLVAFRGQEAFARALLKVSAEEPPRVLFSRGHGELDLEGVDAEAVHRLRLALERDGFDVGEWNAADGPVPADADVLAVLGTRQPFTDRELAHVREWVEAGGRLIAAPSRQEVEEGLEGGAATLLFGYGMVPRPGIVCQPLTDRLGREVQGLPECARVVVESEGLSASHPLTETLRRRGRRLEFVHSPSFRRGGARPGGILLDLVHSQAGSWRDLAGATGTHDFRHDPEVEEEGRFRLVMTAELPGAPAAGTDGPGGGREGGRVLGVAGASFFADGSFDTNRDFLVAAFNWMAEREHLVRVAPRRTTQSLLDVSRGRAPAVLTAVLVAGLPLACALAGAFVAWRRRSA